jgi:hypothetical protein
MAYLTRIRSVFLLAEIRGSRITDTHLEDPASGLEFDVLGLDGAVSIHLGVHLGEPWYRWIWMWESSQEADLAHSQLPPGFDESLEGVITSIRTFLQSSLNTDSDDARIVSLDLTPQLIRLGLEMAAIDMTKDQVMQELAQYRRLAASR